MKMSITVEKNKVKLLDFVYSTSELFLLDMKEYEKLGLFKVVCECYEPIENVPTKLYDFADFEGVDFGDFTVSSGNKIYEGVLL